MKSIKISLFAAFFAVAALASTAFINVRLLNKTKTVYTGFAVVELFTSEGCSSCPPADELIAKIQKESKGKTVYILAYHVDYWNRLGWKDQFSSPDYSKRQNNYANYLNLQSVYTPQIVVNGKTEFIGSQERTFRNAINAGLQHSGNIQLSLNVITMAQNEATIKYSAKGVAKNTGLFLAMVQKNSQTKIERGEKGVHTLSHVQNVGKLQQVPLTQENGLAKVALLLGFDTQKWEIMGFLQDTKNGIIKGAARANLVTAISAHIKPAVKLS